MAFLLRAAETLPRGNTEERRDVSDWMREYELVFIVHPDVDEEGFKAIVERVSAQITSGGGQVTQIDTWGRRKLAYPIHKVHEGQYVVMQTQLPPEGIGELERVLKLTEPVMRHLLIRTDE